jgi:hypothetical protein
MRFTWSLGACLALTHLMAAHAGGVPAPATGLADAAALRATVYGTPPQDIAPLPARVPLELGGVEDRVRHADILPGSAGP